MEHRRRGQGPARALGVWWGTTQKHEETRWKKFAARGTPSLDFRGQVFVPHALIRQLRAEQRRR